MSMSSLRAIISTVFAMVVAMAHGQLHPPGPTERGGGTVQGCDTSLYVGFTSQFNGSPYSHVFSAEVQPGSTFITGTVWSCYIYQQLYQYVDVPEMLVEFPGPGDYPVCLTVNALDAGTQLPCSTTTCDLFQPLADSTCISLVPDFTVSGISGGSTVTFMDLSSFAAGVVGTQWTFGDGVSTADVTPTHTFDGPGPFQVCLTVVGPGPVNCTATVCKWLYLGPPGVACSTVLDQGFLFLQHENLVGVLDTSFTAGLDSDITWDFGDGYTAQGNVAVHAYSTGSFELCSTVRVWGPQTIDTCTSTMCRPVEAYAVAVVEEHAQNGSLHMWPNPFSEQLSIAGLGPGVAEISIHDACGRRVYQALAPLSSPFVTLDLEQLAAGTYTLLCTQGERTEVGRVLKH